MAGKRVNVVYTVDDSQLLKARATIQGAAKDTKAAEDAMNKYSESVKQGGGTISNTIAGATLKMQQLRAQIELTDQRDTQRLNNLKQQYSAAQAKVEELSKALRDNNKAGEEGNAIFTSFKNTMLAVFSVAAIRQITSTALEMTKLAGEVQAVSIAFKRAFVDAPIILQKLREATHKTITDFDLMKQSIQAQNLGIPIEHLAQLLEFAATRAQQTGQSVDYLVDSIVKGIGRKSILFFDQLGISTTRLKEEMGGLAIRSQEVGDVSAAVVRVANEELKKMGGYVETGATKVDQLTVSYQKFRQELSKIFESGGVADFFTVVTDGARRALMGAEAYRKEIADQRAAQIAGSLKTREDLDKEIQKREESIKEIDKEIEALSKKTPTGFLSKFTETTDQKQNKDDLENLQRTRDAVLLVKNSLEELTVSFKETENPITKVSGLIPVLEDKIANLNDELTAATSEGAIAAFKDQIKELQGELDRLNNLSGEEKDLNLASKLGFDVLVDTAEEKLDDLDKLLDKFNKEKAKDIDDAYDLERTSAMSNKDDIVKIEDEKQAKIIEARKKAAKIKEDIEKKELQLAQQGLQTILYSALISNRANRDQDLQDLQDYYQSQLDAAGNNELAKASIQKQQKVAEDKLRQQQLEQDRDDAITKIEIDTAVAVAKTFAEYGFTPAAIGLAAAVAALGLIQIATVKQVSSRSLKARAFAKGEVGIDGPGTGTSDSINARLSRGESVINADATARSPNLLEAINERRIDDRILTGLAASGGSQAPVFDSEGIIKAIKSEKVDYFVQGYVAMKVVQVNDNFRKKSRARIHGI